MQKRISSLPKTFVNAYMIEGVNRSIKRYDLAALFAALADRTRLRLLNLMQDREVCVCYFVEILAQSQPKISRHLAYLRRAGVVSARRDGKWMHYRIVAPAHEGAEKVLSQTLAALKDDEAMQADLACLNKVCGAAQRPATLDGAPLPALVATARCETC